MDLLQKHLNQWDIKHIETYSSDSFMKEYVTCVRPREDKNESWSCMLGAYERFCDEDPEYRYKVMKITKYPGPLKKQAFEFFNKDHTLFLNDK
jgi:hypothetical protein